MGRDKRNEKRSEHYTKIFRSFMQNDAWRALSPTAQALYPWIKLEWHGPNCNNNGKLRLSVRQAASAMGCSPNTAARAFHDLQAKGFLVQTEGAYLGTEGEGKAPAYELTEIALPRRNGGRNLYRDWKDGSDFPVKKAGANNPTGKNGKTKPRHQMSDGVVIKLGTNRS